MKMDVAVQRQLDNISSGNGAYLEMFLQAAADAGANVRLVFAPWRSFGNRPWARLHPRFAALSDEVVWPRSLRVGQHYWSMSPTVWTRFAIRLGKALVQRLGFNPEIYSFLGDPLEQHEAQIVADACGRDSAATLTVAEYSSMAPVLKLLSYPTRKGVLVHDLFSDRAARFRHNGLAPDFLEISRETEVDWMSAADVCFYASANEMASLGRQLPRSKGVWLRPGPRPCTVSPVPGPARIVFLGTQHAGNLDALRHFLNDIWPATKQRKPDVEFWIAGSIGRDVEQEVRRDPQVKILGRVDDLGTIGGADSIGVAPTRLATGVSIKVAEYLMLGMPTVVYPLALEGFGEALSDLVEIGSTPDEFVDCIINLLDNKPLRSQRSERSPGEVTQRLSNDEVVACIKDELT
jgi:hypothetical protein